MTGRPRADPKAALSHVTKLLRFAMLHAMPELPEVEVTRRGIAPHIEGRPLQRTIVRNASLRWPVAPNLDVLTRGLIVNSTERRGKYLMLHFDTGTQLIHLGMSGSLRLVSRDEPPATHDHIDWVFEQCALRLRDPRRFGAVLWHPVSEGPVLAHPRLARLGVEPFDAAFNARMLHEAIKNKESSIKTLLLGGQIVVGVGNIYASESLFRARIHPLTPGRRVSLARCERLVAAVRATLADAIAAGGSSLRDFVHSDGSSGYFQLDTAVYDRAGLPCKRCPNGIVRKIIQQQRATYYCPRCQR